VLQVGYAKTQARNRFDRSLIRTTTSRRHPGSGALGLISLRNPNLKPWLGDNYEAASPTTPTTAASRLGAFHKHITDFQVSSPRIR